MLCVCVCVCVCVNLFGNFRILFLSSLAQLGWNLFVLFFCFRDSSVLWSVKHTRKLKDLGRFIRWWPETLDCYSQVIFVLSIWYHLKCMFILKVSIKYECWTCFCPLLNVLDAGGVLSCHHGFSCLKLLSFYPWSILNVQLSDHFEWMVLRGSKIATMISIRIKKCVNFTEPGVLQLQ